MTLVDFANEIYTTYIGGFATFFTFLVSSGLFAFVLPLIIFDLAIMAYEIIKKSGSVRR